MGLPATLYIPDRIDEGYGPNDAAMSALARDHDLIICMDCGTLSHGPIAAAEGADVIVLDHHLGGETLPPALAVVNPNPNIVSRDNRYGPRPQQHETSISTCIITRSTTRKGPKQKDDDDNGDENDDDDEDDETTAMTSMTTTV